MSKELIYTFMLILVMPFHIKSEHFRKRVPLSDPCIKALTAGPSTWGAPVTIHQCFGDDRSCKFSTSETSSDATIRYLIQKDDSGAWEEYNEDTWIHAQKVNAKARNNGVTAVDVKILVETNCGCN